MNVVGLQNCLVHMYTPIHTDNRTCHITSACLHMWGNSKGQTAFQGLLDMQQLWKCIYSCYAMSLGIKKKLLFTNVKLFCKKEVWLNFSSVRTFGEPGMRLTLAVALFV